MRSFSFSQLVLDSNDAQIIPPVEWSVKIIEGARMLSHRAKDWRNQEIPDHKRESGGVAEIHAR